LKRNADFADIYGPWALVAGASAGLGASFAERLASRGMNLVLVARRAEVLATLADRLTKQYAVTVRPIMLDLAEDDLSEKLAPFVAGLDIGLLVCNATFPAIGEFLAQPLDAHTRLIEINCRAPVTLVHMFAATMRDRTRLRPSGATRTGTATDTGMRSGIILMSSLTAFQGTPLLAHYGASKAYILALGEGLAYELAKEDIDLLVCCPGATRTENYLESIPAGADTSRIPVMEPSDVAERTLRALGRKTVFIPGGFNKAASFFLRRILSRKTAVRIMASNAERMYGSRN
jgi:short-subunit dehydrogenase